MSMVYQMHLAGDLDFHWRNKVSLELKGVFQICMIQKSPFHFFNEKGCLKINNKLNLPIYSIFNYRFKRR